jgi:hypothetical protein
MRESQLEAKGRRYAQDRGVLFLKFICPGTRGAPDRIVIGPTGITIYVELKRPGQKPRPIQLYFAKMFEARSLSVYSTDNLETLKKLIDSTIPRSNEMET